jgi:hypothetical protein
LKDRGEQDHHQDDETDGDQHFDESEGAALILDFGFWISDLSARGA